MSSKTSTLFRRAIAADRAFPISEIALGLWLQDLQNPLRWGARPIAQFMFAALLHLIWYCKRLPLPQFRNHSLLQRLICWFCKHFVTYEANILILRHFATESNVLTFLIANSSTNDAETGRKVAPVALYPLRLEDMLEHSFVRHDEELFRTFIDIGGAKPRGGPLNWQGWQDVDALTFHIERRWTQIIDFETAHALFMCLFCLLLTAEEYQGAINGFNLDHSIARRIGEIIGDPSVVDLSYNRYPLYLVGPWNLTQRFLMHGFFTEHVDALLTSIRRK